MCNKAVRRSLCGVALNTVSIKRGKIMFYKVYRYSTKATIFSVLTSAAALIFALLAILSFKSFESIVMKVLGTVVCLAAAVFFFGYLSRIYADKIAENDFEQKIKTSVSVALLYCRDHPEQFEEIAAGNDEFAAKYCKNEKGKIVKISSRN
jgi:hypothetical protein